MTFYLIETQDPSGDCVSDENIRTLMRSTPARGFMDYKRAKHFKDGWTWNIDAEPFIMKEFSVRRRV